MNSPIPFKNVYVDLPGKFYTRQLPTPVSAPSCISINDKLAEELGISSDWLGSDAGIAMVAGNEMPVGADPIATVYAGHQFGNWNPQLGDGRAILLGEVIAKNGTHYDLQLKGSGPTPYSRGADGRAPLGPVLREYVVSEAMSALGIPSTRALAAVTTGDLVYREEPLPGAVLLRVAQSHVRIGTFQFFAARRDTEALCKLADHVIKCHYPHALTADNPYIALLDAVIRQQAKLIADWQLVGFIHGVMNTDNMLLSGETIDYGPCSFMDGFNPDQVLSSIDRAGRYAYNNQPDIGHWNLMNLAQALLPLIDTDEEVALSLAQESINAYPTLFNDAHQKRINRKLGFSQPDYEDPDLIDDLFTLMAEAQADFTLTFRRLSELSNEMDKPGGQGVALTGFELPDSFSDWLRRWRKRLALESVDPETIEMRMKAVNPLYIPRNHLIEESIVAAVVDSNFDPFHQLVAVLENPFVDNPEFVEYAKPPRPDQAVLQTFCGT